MKTLKWDDIIADKSRCHLPMKVETNRHNKIIMNPASCGIVTTNWKLRRFSGSSC